MKTRYGEGTALVAEIAGRLLCGMGWRREVPGGRNNGPPARAGAVAVMYRIKASGDLRYGVVPSWRSVCQGKCAPPCLEWNKELYNDSFRSKLSYRFGLRGERYQILKEECEQLDMWNDKGAEKGLKSILGNKDDNLWFAHPMYFLKHLEEAGLLDQSFNPYEGETFGKGTAYEVIVKDNPGFAPVYEKRDNNEPEYYDPDRKQRYALVTYPFNKIVNRENMTPYHHEGVDFRGKTGCEIRAFIHAQVIGSGWGTGSLRPYGQCIIFGNLNDKGIYLLGHLNGLPGLTPGTIVAPGDLVGKVGRSGYGQMEYHEFASHLHVSYYDVQYDSSKEDYLIVKNDGGKTTVDSNVLTLDLVKNPFDHTEPRKK